ncbi:response regulator transcription factor [uncultured Sutterella sp.]|nr:response regulator [uncultured Sutterella sp.]
MPTFPSPDFYCPLARIVDDEETVRNSESFTLRVAGIQTVVYESAEDFLEHDDMRHPGCVVLDVRMPGMSGLELQEEMTRRGIDLPILFISGHGDIPMAVAALKRGAHDFCEKPVAPDKFRAAVREMIEANVASRRAAIESAGKRELYDSLTPREADILKLVAQNLLNREIAEKLGIQEHTVKIHRSNGCRKLGVRSALEVSSLLREIGEL